jgi:hypothetical protein
MRLLEMTCGLEVGSRTAHWVSTGDCELSLDIVELMAEQGQPRST